MNIKISVFANVIFHINVKRQTVCFVYVNPGYRPSESDCVCVVLRPSMKQNGQPAWVMVESSDAGRQFNDSPHP